MPSSTDFFGSDTSCITDLSLIDVQVTNPLTLIGQRILRRWQTQRGALASINDDPNFGWDVTQLVNAKLAPGGIAQAQASLEQEAEKDQQVESCSVRVSQQTGGGIRVDASFTTSQGPFSLTLDVRDLSVEAVFNFGES